jgi:hypothetical protein
MIFPEVFTAGVILLLMTSAASKCDPFKEVVYFLECEKCQMRSHQASMVNVPILVSVFLQKSVYQNCGESGCIVMMLFSLVWPGVFSSFILLL